MIIYPSTCNYCITLPKQIKSNNKQCVEIHQFIMETAKNNTNHERNLITNKISKPKIMYKTKVKSKDKIKLITSNQIWLFTSNNARI